MKREELLKFLSDYAKKVNTGEASTKDFSEIKNYIRQTYDAGNLDKETMADLGKKASFNFKNMGKAPELQNLPSKILEKGGSVAKLDDLPVVKKPKGGKLRSFGPLLGMLGAGAMAMGAGEKAMAGDLGGAGLEVADAATDLIPAVGQIKSAIAPTEIGRDPLEPVSMKGSLFEQDYNNMPKNVNNSSINPKILPASSEQPIDATQEPKKRARYQDLQKLFGKK